MSKIAEALAKAKERTGTTTAPFITGSATKTTSVVDANKKALREARNRRIVWSILLTIAAACTAWMLTDRLKQVNASTPAPPPASDTASAAPGDTPAPESSPAAPPEPRADIARLANTLTFSAVLPGERPRLIYKGRIISAGEIVEAELTFTDISDGHIHFTDRRGASYSRKY